MNFMRLRNLGHMCANMQVWLQGGRIARMLGQMARVEGGHLCHPAGSPGRPREGGENISRHVLCKYMRTFI